jgi:CheY-like chemotaxis protein
LNARSRILLIAEDDEDDYLLAKDAFAAHFPMGEMRRVADGEELLDYLRRRGRFANAARPAIILLDLNMPKMDGREALRAIKSDPELAGIPVVALTGSSAQEDVLFAYANGVNSFIRKPVGFAEFVDFMKVCYQYNLDFVQTPKAAR